MGDARGQLWAGRRVPSPAPGVPWDAIAPHCHPDVPLGHIPEQASDKVTGDMDRSGVSWRGGLAVAPPAWSSGTLSHPSLPPLLPDLQEKISWLLAQRKDLTIQVQELQRQNQDLQNQVPPGTPTGTPPPGRVLLHHPPSSPPSLAPAHPCSSLPSSGQVLGRKDPPSAAPRRLPDVPGVGGLGTAGPPG